MTNVDQFESVFRSAAREVFEPQPVTIETVLVVTDLDAYEADLFTERVKGFLRVLDQPGEAGEGPTWRTVRGEEFRDVPGLLEIVEAERPDLICTYRHLQTEGWRWPFTLGEYLGVLTQVTSTPVVVLPHPKADRASEHAVVNTNMVMALTDHLVGDNRLVSYAARFTEDDGTLFLAHVENEVALDRIIDVIAKLPDIPTDLARTEILERLLKDPADYIRSCREVLHEQGLPVTVEPVVKVGHQLFEYQRLVEDHEIDLLVLNTKDEDQLAMHGLVYPLAVEMRQIPLLML